MKGIAMKKSNISLWLILSSVIMGILAGCKDEPPNPPPDLKPVADTVQTQKTEIKDAKAPQWAKELPVKQGYLYMVGVGQSRQIDIAEKKAIMNARTLMAEKIHQSAIPVGEKKETGGASSESNVDYEVILENSLVTKTERVKEDKLWKVYVLLEMKTE
jgi:hypothetical protein